MRVILKLSDTNTINITDDIVMGNVVLAKRCDEAFGIGKFTFESKTINYNIPPYTPLIIDNVYYVCSSTLSENLITNTYLHNVEILDAASILSRFVIGSKNFSITGTNRKDYDKVNILCELLKQKYGVSIVINDMSDLIKEEEFTFGAGATFYDMLCEILRIYNKSIIVESISSTNITLSFISLDGFSYAINENDILSYSINQNIDDYCKRLEGEMTNVIDRNNKTILTNYTCRIDDVRLDYDNCKIILPTRIEQLNNFGVYAQTKFNILDIEGKYFSILRTTDYIENVGYDYDMPEEAKTVQYWLSVMESSMEISQSQTPLYKILNDIATDNDMLVTAFYSLKLKVNGGSSYVDENGYYDYKFDLEWDSSSNDYFETIANFTEWVIERNKYDLLTAREKPKYAYYKSGDNYIDGMNVAYKDDFWNNVLGITKKPFFSQHNISDSRYDDESSIAYGLVSRIPLDTNPVLNKYYIEYYAITNPLISVEKNNEMLDCSRSYDKGSNFIDFDKLINAMNINNSWLGQPELALELDVTNYQIPPTITNKMVFKNKTWYVSNYTITYSFNNIIMNLNLVSNYNKVADVIGVSTQFEETKNPMENIIERPILIEVNDTSINRNNLWVGFKFNKSKRTLYKRGVLLEYDHYKIIYCEMLDHYAFDKTTVNENGNVYSCEDVAYGDSNNEVSTATISICELDNLTFEQSMNLPHYDGTVESVIIARDFKIYKDAREKLMFTILLK